MAVSTRQKLIEAAADRFYKDGFRNVGIDQILTDVGISKTAFYKHFESKDDLMLDVLQHQDRWLCDWFRKTVREKGGPTAVGQLRALFYVVEAIVEMDDFHGCFFVNAAMEFPLAHDPAHEAARRNKQAVEDLVTEIAERAGANDPVALAEDLCLVMEGTYVRRTVCGKERTLEIARRTAEAVILAHTNEPE